MSDDWKSVKTSFSVEQLVQYANWRVSRLSEMLFLNVLENKIFKALHQNGVRAKGR